MVEFFTNINTIDFGRRNASQVGYFNRPGWSFCEGVVALQKKPEAGVFVSYYINIESSHQFP